MYTFEEVTCRVVVALSVRLSNQPIVAYAFIAADFLPLSFTGAKVNIIF